MRDGFVRYVTPGMAEVGRTRRMGKLAGYLMVVACVCVAVGCNRIDVLSFFTFFFRFLLYTVHLSGCIAMSPSACSMQ